jgi:hypothetical protein
MMNRTMWTTTDGHTFRSIPTDIPKTWEWRTDEDCPGEIAYVCGEYEIERIPYGSRHTFRLTRCTVPLGIGPFPTLKAAKAHAEKNARGEEIVNVA